MFIYLFPFPSVQFSASIFPFFQLLLWLRVLFQEYPSTTFPAREASTPQEPKLLPNPLCLPQLIDEQEPQPQVQEEYRSHY